MVETNLAQCNGVAGAKIISANGSGLSVVALSKNLKLTTTLDRDITQNPCYVPFLFRKHDTNS